MRLFKRITALALAAVTAGALGLSAAAEVKETAAEPIELEVYCPKNEDPEFPFCLDINVMPGSIQYIDLDEPVYGFERVLDEEALDFDVSFSLKDEYKSFDSYTFKVFSADYSEEIASEQHEVDEMICVSGLSLATGYKISMALESESLNAYYGGSFIVQAELDSTLAVDLFYQFAGMDGDAAPYADDLNESEPRNNNASTPDNLLSSRIMAAKTIYGDTDYFRFYCPPKMTGSSDDDEIDYSGMTNIEFTLVIPAEANLHMECRDENGSLVNKPRSFVTGTSGNSYYFKINNANVDSTYVIKITSSNTSEISYKLSVSYEYRLAWYGQYTSKDADGEYWNTNKLDEIICYDPKIPNKYYYVFQEGVKDRDAHLFTTACGVVASAMIFRNMGATMTGYDCRTGQSGILQADPFTAMLSNCDYDGYELKGKTIWPNLNNDWDDYPDGCHSGVIGKRFGLTFYPINVTETSLRNAIASHGYVLIYFDANTNNPHFMVLTGLESGSGSFSSRATVYDPAASTYAAGAGVKLSMTTSGYSKKTISNISWAGYFA